MNLSKQIAKHLREVYFGKNWTASSLKNAIADVTWEQATTQVHGINTIATLVYHMTYYLRGVTNALSGEPLGIKDKYSFTHPPINSQDDWDNMLEGIWTEVETFAVLVEQLPESTFGEDMLDGTYGNYYRNIAGIIEHCHYHVGQIVVINKILTETTNS